MDKANIQTLKGFRDFLPSDAKKRLFVIEKLRKVFSLYGFEPLETPALEYEEVLMGKYGDEGEKLIYKFEDNGGRKVAMRYDQTVPLARVVATYPDLTKPFKRYQIQPVWRSENTQKGRFREFMQCDIDTVGSNSLIADAEVIACILACAKELGFEGAKMILNDREVFKDLEPKYIIAIDKLKKIGKEKVKEELIAKGMDSDKATDLLASFENTKPTENISKVKDILKNLGVKDDEVVFDSTLARGMDYYTGLIFELVDENYSAGSLGGGGRFDNLIGIFTNDKVPAVGFAFGFDRLVEAMTEKGLFTDELSSTKVLITIFNKELANNSIMLAQELRRYGVNTELYPNEDTDLGKQLKYADKKSIPYVAIIGPDEVKNNEVVIKNLKKQTQEKVALSEVAFNFK